MASTTLSAEGRLEAETCGGHGESSVEIDYRALLHDSHGA